MRLGKEGEEDKVHFQSPARRDVNEGDGLQSKDVDQVKGMYGTNCGITMAWGREQLPMNPATNDAHFSDARTDEPTKETAEK